MKTVDRILQQWRIDKVRPYVSQGARVLDLGCADGALYQRLQATVGEVVGIDPTLDHNVVMGRCRLIAGRFPKDLPDTEPFDAITMLAVLEHIPLDEQPGLAAECARRLRPGGHLIITVPSPVVDRILSVLQFLRLIDGMSLEEHYGFEPSVVPALFGVNNMRLVKASAFQLGCNNLFVFQRSSAQ
jgi:2-polyprenyl-3-methyl-5-hydroxy-6-metoxy-1,4-benzoquinol methylase